MSLVLTGDRTESPRSPLFANLTLAYTDILFEIGDFIPWRQFPKFLFDEFAVLSDDKKWMCETRKYGSPIR
jgi:hypothetical protein